MKNTWGGGQLLENQIVKLSKNNSELSNAYYCLADVFYKKSDYSNAIFMFKKVDSLAELSGNSEDRIMANLFLAGIYSKLALKNQAEERFDTAEKLIKKENIPDALMQLEYQKSSFFEENMEWCKSVPLKKDLVRYFENKIRSEKEERYKINLAITSTELAYTLLKCNENTEEAKMYLQKYEEIFRNIPEEKNHLIPQYYIDKGIVSAEENDMKKAEYWFDLAYQSAVTHNLETLRLRCMEEQIKYGLSNTSSKKEYFETYLSKKNEIKKHAETVIAEEQKHLENKEAEKTRKIIVFALLLSVLLLAALSLYYINRQNNLKRRFEKIIENIRNEKELSENILTQNTLQKETDAIESLREKPETRIMSEEKEKELLAKIEEFEKTELFTDEKFTMGKFASALQSNAKYINYVLQKYRGNTFSDYLNELRVKYIVNKLIEHPEHLNYKISYLAEISGFSTHSRFTHIFKKVLDIAPSEFISQLNKQNKAG
ncbi:MAG: helix-turn-helix domain-containing protein [Bergeyella sp.]